MKAQWEEIDTNGLYKKIDINFAPIFMICIGTIDQNDDTTLVIYARAMWQYCVRVGRPYRQESTERSMFVLRGYVCLMHHFELSLTH